MFARNFYLILLFSFYSFVVLGQPRTPKKNWQNLDLLEDGVPGISTEKAYRLLLENKVGNAVVVAVIDGGVDVNHEDLHDVIWVNLKEALGDSLDNDNNGYIDDINGWNFIGNPSGENVHYDNLEVLRLIRALQPKYDSVSTNAELAEDDRAAFEQYLEMNSEYANEKQTAGLTYRAMVGIKSTLDSIIKNIGADSLKVSDLKRYKARNKFEGRTLKFVRKSLRRTPDFEQFYDELKEGVDYYSARLKYHLNMDYDPRSIIGDDYSASDQKYYGNNDVVGPDASHGTHVAGIIGASRNNGVGINGVADHVKIMAIRTVPDGDERDKDVANAIFYAVDNGAKVINMSFGKAYVKDKFIVDSAVRYAMNNDVLLVHAAGNEGQDNDKAENYPNRDYIDSLGMNIGTAQAWIEVGATGWKYDASLVADFSNYGKGTVDVFAPGVDINSTMPGSKYKEQQGTSMAAPVVSGLAGLIRSYYPDFSAIEVKEIILESVIRPKHKIKVTIGKSRKRLRMSDICTTGGIINAYNALKLAEERTTKQ